MGDADSLSGGHLQDPTPSRWAELTDLLGEALELPRPAREQFVDTLRAQYPHAAQELESLLAHHERTGEFLLDLPPFELVTTDRANQTLGAYRLIRTLGCGGMGVVYLAERSDGAFTRHVAVKLLSPVFAHSHDRLRREREALARLEHPHIARLLDGGTTADGWPYLVMEYVDGLPVDEYCARHDLSVDARLRLLLQICAGVAHAHQRLVIHCDIKPENILVTADGTAKLLDFGIAKLLDPNRQPTLLRPATPAYSSPEQLRGEALTTASDVYAVGVLAYMLLTGRWPYVTRPADLVETIQAALVAEPLAASRIPGVSPARARQLRGDLDTVLLKAVAKAPSRRYASVQQLADDLDAVRRGLPVRARPDTVAYRLRKLVGRHRVATAALSTSVAAMAAALIFSLWQAHVAQQRFEDLREFARTVLFEVSDSLLPIPGTTAARKLLVDTALRYLDRLSEQRSSDPALREELAGAYIRVGRVQGGAFLPNLGETAGAIASFRRAIEIAGTAPSTPGLERLRIEAHIDVGQLASDPVQANPDYDRAIAAAEAQLARAPDDVPVLRLLAEAYHGKATNAHLTNDVPQHELAALQAIGIRERIAAAAPGNWRDRLDLAREHSQLSLALSQKGDHTGALAKLQLVRTILEEVIERSPGNQVVLRELAAARSRAGVVLTATGRWRESAAELHAAIELLTPLVRADASNRQYEAELATAWWRLGDTRRAERRLGEALELHQQALRVSRERAARDSSGMFLPWGLAMRLNAVGEILLEVSPDRWREARAHFSEARDLVEPLLARAPSFNELRKQLAMSYEGIGRAELAGLGPASATVRDALEKSADEWREVFARSNGDHREIERQHQVEKLLESLDARQTIEP